MNIRKHWKRLLLTTTALFWASCTSENENTFPTIGQDTPHAVDPSASSDSHIESSNENAAESSSSEASAPSSNSITQSSSSEANPSSSVAESSSSAEVTCAPTDSVISYYPPDYSESVAKSNAEEKANRAGVAKIDSIMKAQETIPQALANLRQQLSMFVALYGAPVLIHPDEVCSDGITRPTQAYLDYLKMKEEWEKNKPALDEECQKIYEDKLKEIEQSIKECLESSNPSTDLTACDLKTMCPLYGIDSKCSYKYSCNDGLSCRRTEGESDMNCTDKQGEKINYTKNEFEKKYYEKRGY
jgi:hypothetical protein